MAEINRNYDYERHKERSRANQAEMSERGRDIGAIPEIVNSERRESCRRDFKLFLETYFPRAFSLRWSADHLRVIEAVQRAVLNGGCQAIAMPRGTGKTSICERGVLWASLYGHSRFSLLIAADKTRAQESLAKIVLEIETNELLGKDFPEACYPIRMLEGIAQRGRGQMHSGQRTYIRYGKDKLVFASISGAPCSGIVLGVGGIKSAVRGANHTTREGRILRPSLVLIDDPQTRDSAGSEKQCATREQIVSADILGCAAPGESIAALMTVTVIYRGDMADRLLDRAKHPTWHGLRCKLLYSFPSAAALTLWEEYWQLRCDELVADGDGSQSTAFYAAHRSAMDEGAVVAWPERYKQGEELSALQHAMNLFYQDRAAFFSEFQNEPEDTVATTRLVAPELLAQKLNGLPRGTVSSRSHLLTGFIDIHEDLLYWGVIGWGDGYSGDLVDYGYFPPQKKKYFSKRECRPTLTQWYAQQTGVTESEVTVEEALHAGLTALTNELFARPWTRQDDAVLALRRMLIDASHGPTTALVKSFAANCAHKASVWPSHGVGKNRVSTFHPTKAARENGDRFGHRWRLVYASRRQNVAHLNYDANYWKTFLWTRLRVGQGATGSLALCGEWASGRSGQARPRDAEQHKLLIDHLHSESPHEVASGETRIEEWRHDPAKDNHLLDVLVGCCVAASFEGVALTGHEALVKPKARKSFSMRKAAK